VLNILWVFSIESVENTGFYTKTFYLISIESIEWEKTVSQPELAPAEAAFLQQALNADCGVSNIRLREGEYQYSLAKAIASSELELHFPDVKDLARGLFSEEKTNDIGFIRKIQTILKKMEKSGVVIILPKKMPWDLQRYGLSSFKFQDSDKNIVILATDQQIKQARDLLRSTLDSQGAFSTKPSVTTLMILALALTVGASYAAILWSLIEPVINPAVFVPAFSIAMLCSLLLGRALSQR
jgi:hypothetical protein